MCIRLQLPRYFLGIAMKLNLKGKPTLIALITALELSAGLVTYSTLAASTAFAESAAIVSPAAASASRAVVTQPSFREAKKTAEETRTAISAQKRLNADPATAPQSQEERGVQSASAAKRQEKAAGF
jgi:hypothetical protein